VVTITLTRVGCWSGIILARRPSWRRQAANSLPVLPPKGRTSRGSPPKYCSQRATLTPLPPAQRRSESTMFFSSHRTCPPLHSRSVGGLGERGEMGIGQVIINVRGLARKKKSRQCVRGSKRRSRLTERDLYGV